MVNRGGVACGHARVRCNFTNAGRATPPCHRAPDPPHAACPCCCLHARRGRRWEHTYGGFFATIAKAIAPMPDSVFSMMEYSLSKHPEMFEELMGVQAAFMSLGHNVSKNILMTGSFVYAFQVRRVQGSARHSWAAVIQSR